MNPQSLRTTMAGKGIFYVQLDRIINFHSGFRHKRLCTGPTFTAGDRCVYRCGQRSLPQAPPTCGCLAGRSGTSGRQAALSGPV